MTPRVNQLQTYPNEVQTVNTRFCITYKLEFCRRRRKVAKIFLYNCLCNS